MNNKIHLFQFVKVKLTKRAKALYKRKFKDVLGRLPEKIVTDRKGYSTWMLRDLFVYFGEDVLEHDPLFEENMIYFDQLREVKPLTKEEICEL